MDEQTDTAAVPSKNRKAWQSLGLLVGVLALINIALVPGEQASRASLLQLLWTGNGFCQPILFAVWAAIGPPPAIKRWCLTLAAFALVVMTAIIAFHSRGGDPAAGLLPTEGGIFIVSAVLALLVRRFGRWRLQNASLTPADTATTSNQFSLQFLLILTTICSVLLLMGRSILAGQQHFGWPKYGELGMYILIIGIVICLAVPTLLLPLIVIVRGFSLKVLMAWPLVWIVLTSLAVEGITAINPPGDSRWEVARQVVFIQFSMTAIATMAAWLVRAAGYRLTNDQSPTVS